MKDIQKALKDALIKKALGYTSTEVIEEYTNGDDGMVLQKKKVTSKEVPPDPQSFKALFDIDKEKNEFESMTDEELEKERDRLIKLITKKEVKDEK